MSTKERDITQGVSGGRLGYSTLEVAAALGCSEKHIKNLMRSGDIPSLKLGQRRIVLESDLRKALEDRVQHGWETKRTTEAT